MPRDRSMLLLLGAACLSLSAVPALTAPEARVRITVTYGADKSAEPLDGRVLLLLSTDKSAEPRFQISDTSLKTQQVFGVDVLGWKPGEEAVFAGDVLGYPAVGLGDIPPGTYQVQALLHRYETFHRADGHVVKLPMDRGEGQQWSKAPGNLYSTPRSLTIDPAKPETIRIELDQVIPPIPDPPTTKYIKHEKIQSERLTKFWGRPMYLSAHVLLPGGLRGSPGGALPRGHQPRPLLLHHRRVSPGAARPEPEARVLGPVPPGGIQQDPGGARAPVLQGLDGARLPALPAGGGRAREPLLRRFLRGELAESRALRRRHHLRAHPLPREEVPRPRRGLGALHVRRLDRGLGGARGADPLSRGVQRLLRGLPRPHRLPRLHHGQPLRGRERVLLERALQEGREAGPPQLPRPPVRDGRAGQPARAGARDEEPFRGPVGHLGGGLLAGWARRVSRSGSSTSARG